MYSSTIKLVIPVGQMMATHRLRLSCDLMIVMILIMGKFRNLSSFKRGRKATASDGYPTLLSIVLSNRALQRLERTGKECGQFLFVWEK